MRAEKPGAGSGSAQHARVCSRWRWCAWTSSPASERPSRAAANRRTPEDFASLFAREFPRVARTIHHVVGDRARAEEVTQDAFLELLRHWGKVSAYDRPDLWVRRVAIRKAQRERHRTWRRAELERVTLGPVTSSRRPRRPRCSRRPATRTQAARRGGALLLRGPADDGDRRDPGLLGVHRLEPAAHGATSSRSRARRRR